MHVTVLSNVTYFFFWLLQPKKINLRLNSRIRPCVKLIQFYRAMEQMAVSFKTLGSFVAGQSPAQTKSRTINCHLGAVESGFARNLTVKASVISRLHHHTWEPGKPEIN